jgi:hypothetical protein
LVRVGLAETSLALAASQFGRKRVEALLPEATERVEPGVDLVERRRIDGIQPPGALRPDRRETAVAQDPEVLRDRRLRDPELRLDDRRDRPGRLLASGQQLEDPPSDWVAKDVKGVHGRSIEGDAYISQYWYAPRFADRTGVPMSRALA